MKMYPHSTVNMGLHTAVANDAKMPFIGNYFIVKA